MNTRRTLATLVIGAGLLMSARDARAGHCIVDPLGGGTDLTIDDALAGSCGTAGSIIDVYCPSGGCVHLPATVLSKNDILIRSMEVLGTGGPAAIGSPNGGYGVRVRKSSDITLEGFDAITSIDDSAIWIQSSDVDIIGPTGLATPRYTDVSGPTGIEIVKNSTVYLNGVGVSSCTVGMDIRSGIRHPSVLAEGIALLDNDVAVEMSGGPTSCPVGNGPVLEIRSDFDVAWTNYVMGNTEGFLLGGSAELLIDHTILASNVYRLTAIGGLPALFRLEDASRLEGRNLLLYDNDHIYNPGVCTGWTACMSGINTPGMILHHKTCGEAVFEACTFVDNQTDLVFHLDAALGAGSGLLTLDHVVVANSWGKVLSQSTFHPSCAMVLVESTMFWDNRVDSDPVGCKPIDIIAMDPVFTYAGAPGTLSGYPSIPAVYTNLYLQLAPVEPTSPYDQPADLYSGRDWTVDGSSVDDDDALDVGYHNPM